MKDKIMTSDKIKYVKGSGILSCFLAFCFIYGDYSSRKVELQMNSVIAFQVLIYFFLAFFAVNMMFFIISNSNVSNFEISIPCTRKKLFYVVFFIIIASWTIHIVFKYPGANTLDSMNEIRINQGIYGMSEMHPIFHAFMYNLFLQLGVKIGSLNIGLFLSVLVEMLIRAAVFSYAIVFLYDIHTPFLWICISVVFFCLNPYIAGNVGLVSKDACCTDFIVLFIVMLGYYQFDSNSINDFPKRLLFFASVTFSALFRNNGIICILPVLFYIFIKDFKNKRVVALILISVVSPFIIKMTLSTVFDTQKMSINEALSLQYQQTSRFIIYHSDLLSEDEKTVLSKVLPYDDIPQLYDEESSDPVKSQAKAGLQTKEDVKNFLRVWLKLFFKSPKCYFDAVAKQSIYLFYPRNQSYFPYSTDCNSEYSNLFPEYFSRPDGINKLTPYYKDYLDRFHSFTFIAPLNCMPFYVISLLVLYLFSYNLKHKKRLAMLPGTIVLIEAFFAANISANARYIYPVIWSFVIWVGIFFSEASTKTVSKKK